MSVRRKRPYSMRKRRESQDETRRRIVEATMQLHEEVGPRATNISAIAERAGVQRLTVYRHFPDEAAVFRACTSHWLSLNPAPDPALWRQVEDASGRAREALRLFYDYFRRTHRMWAVAHRDVAAVPALQEPMYQFQSYLRSVGDELFRHFKSRRNRRLLAATIHHVLSFQTWASLETERLSDDDKVATALAWIAAQL